MSRMRQRIAQRLKESQNTTAMLTTFQECDMSALFEMRDKFKDQFEKAHGGQLAPYFFFAARDCCGASMRAHAVVVAVFSL